MLAAVAIFVISQIEFNFASLWPRIESALLRIVAADVYIVSVRRDEPTVFLGQERFFLAVIMI